MPPEVYDVGPTLVIDDFCAVAWNREGALLLQNIQVVAKAQGAMQTVVVCGAHDSLKQQCLRVAGLSAASEWYVGAL